MIYSNRIESKFKLKKNKSINDILNLLYKNKFQLLHDDVEIESLYFDTYDDMFLNDHLNGLYERSKIRIRTYLNSSFFKNFFYLEHKFKQGDTINKFKKKVNFDFNKIHYEDLIYINNEIKSFKNFFKIYKKFFFLFPKKIINYQRSYFYSKNFNGLRITLDKNILSYNIENSIKCNFARHNDIIIELKIDKSNHNYDNFFNKEISEIAHFTSFSKYLFTHNNFKYF